MPITRKDVDSNKILSMIPDKDFALLSEHLEHVVLSKGLVLANSGEPFGHVYFLTEGQARSLRKPRKGCVPKLNCWL